MNKKNNLFNILLLILISIAVAGIVIYFLPDFILDDYYIFTQISFVPKIPISLDPNIDFFLFFRPISYFSFWLDYHLFYTNSILMKLHNTVYYILSGILVYNFFVCFSKQTKKLVKPKIFFLLSLIFILHPDNLISIYWISNRTEILFFNFYIATILSFFKWLEKPIFKYRILITLFFILAILTKQSALNLPFILTIFYLIIKNDKITSVIKIFFIEFFIVGILIIANTFSYSEGSYYFLSQLWKKMFSVLGIILYSFNELLGENLYTYFLFHKSLAVLLLFTGMLLIYLFFHNKRHEFLTILKEFTPYLVMLLFSFFPRIIITGGRRLNTLQIFYLLVIFFYVYYENYHNNFKKYLLRFLYLWLVITILNDVFEVKHQLQIQEKSEQKIASLLEFKPPNNYLILISDGIKYLPYETYFFKYKKWGKMNFEISNFRIVVFRTSGRANFNSKITIKKNNGRIVISTIGKTMIEYVNQKNRQMVISEKFSASGRLGYSEVIIDEKKLNPHNKRIIYFDGEKWDEL